MRIVTSGHHRHSRHTAGFACVAMALLSTAINGCSNSNKRDSTAWQPSSVEQPSAMHGVKPDPTRPGSIAALYAPPGSVPKVRGVYKVGKPYVVAGQTYYPTEDPSYDRTGIASWYGTDFHGKQTANGELFDMGAITAAHPTLPLPSLAYVTNLRNGRTILVRINDRGPYKPNRIIDLSRHSAGLLGFESQGTTEIRVRYAGPASLDPNDTSRERRYLAGQPWGRVARAPGRSWFGLGMGGAQTR